MEVNLVLNPKKDQLRQREEGDRGHYTPTTLTRQSKLFLSSIGGEHSNRFKALNDIKLEVNGDMEDKVEIDSDSSSHIFEFVDATQYSGEERDITR